MQADADRIGFEPIGPEHYPLLKAWLDTPHWREWWSDDPEKELGFIRDMVEGLDTTRPFAILQDGEPVGYIQYWFIGHYQNESWIRDNPWLAELPSDAIGIDLSIGPAEKLSRGIGSAALRAFIERLAGDGHRTIIIDPDRGNARALRAYEKAGFRPVPHLEGRTGDAVIMQFDPNAEATS